MQALLNIIMCYKEDITTKTSWSLALASVAYAQYAFVAFCPAEAESDGWKLPIFFNTVTLLGVAGAIYVAGEIAEYIIPGDDYCPF
jgi:hypothetical protein